MLAISLVVTFGFLAFNLFSTLANEQLQATQRQVDDLQKQIDELQKKKSEPPAKGVNTALVSDPAIYLAALPAQSTTTITPPVTTSNTDPTKTNTETPKQKDATPPVANATSRSSAEDFAKQLLVMLGTLMASVTSYYFATASSAGTIRATVDALKHS